MQELERLIKDAPPIARWPGLDAALAAARALDLGLATIRAEQKLKLAEEKLTDLLACLAPWVGSAAALRQFVPPDPAEIQRFTEAARHLGSM